MKNPSISQANAERTENLGIDIIKKDETSTIDKNRV